MEKVLVSVLFSFCIFLLWLYLEQRRRVKKKKALIKQLTTENVSLIEKVYTLNSELKQFNHKQNETP